MAPRWVQARQFDREDALAQNRQQHVVGAQQADAAFHEDGGEQARSRADVADALQHRSELHQFRARSGGRPAACGSSNRMRADQPRRDQEGERIEHEDRVAPEQHGRPVRPATRPPPGRKTR